MFKAGDAVVHPIRGAGVIVDIVERRWRGEKTQYYRIDLLGQQGSSLMLPVKKAKTLGLRAAVSSPKLQHVWNVLDDAPDALPKKHKNRYRMLDEKIHTGEVLQVAEALRDVAWRRYEEGRLTTRDKRMYEKGLALLAGEIAATEGIEIEEAEATIKSKLQESFAQENEG